MNHADNMQTANQNYSNNSISNNATNVNASNPTLSGEIATDTNNHPLDNHINNEDAVAPIAKPDPNSIVLNQLVIDDTAKWQIHNCKIIDKTVTQDAPLPFLYHYDALSEEVKTANPLNATLLKDFNKVMTADEAALRLGIDKALISVPWQVKVAGTLVMFNERLQIALRVKFTNTAKELDPIYTKTAEEALKIAMADWHFYGDVFVLNKSATPLVVTAEDAFMSIEKANDYQPLPKAFAISLLSVLQEHKNDLPILDEAIQLRLI